MKQFILLSFTLFFSFQNITLAQSSSETNIIESIHSEEEPDNESEQFEQNMQTKGVIPAYDHRLDKDNPQNRFASKVADGTLELNDLPLLIIYWIDYVTWIAGSVSVIFLVYGGYQYLFSGVTDDKEDGKKTVLYVACGLPVIFFAWYVVNFLQGWITGGT